MFRRRGQDGFSLLSVVVASLIMTISFLFVSQILLQTQIIGQQQERFAQFNDLRDEMMANLANECSIANTVLAPENAEGLRCLYDGECRPGEPRPLNLRDALNEQIYGESSTKNRQLNIQGMPCDPDRGDCTHEFNMQYTLKCADGAACKLPFLLVEGKFQEYAAPPDDSGETKPADERTKLINYNLYRFEKQVVYRRPYLNCKDVMDRGLAQSPPVQMASGVYRLDPDGAGGECPFEVYCDLAPTSDGGGWALVANQGLASQNLTERAPPLHQGMTGRLPDKLVKVLLESSSRPGNNNVRVKIDSRISRKHVLSFSVPRAATPGTYTNAQTLCSVVEPQAVHTQLESQGKFAFVTSSPAVKIGYIDQKFQCDSCDPEVANPVCTEMPRAGCCSQHTPVEGSVWVR